MLPAPLRRRTPRVRRSPCPVVAVLACLIALLPGAHGQELTPLALQPVASGLSFPSYATAPRGDARVFVCELYAGTIRIVKDGQVLATPFLDLSNQVLPDGERGLLCMAFHPQFAVNRRFYVTYNDVATGDLMLVSYRVKASDPDQANPTGQVLLRISQPYPEHNGGMLQFDAAGMLVMSVGDGGGPLDPLDQGQALDTLRGKLLRLDVDVGSPGQYGIPADNPFVGVPGVLPEILAYGLRNPWRFAIDPSTGALFVADVGADTIEEINVIPAGSPGGQNFGWRCKEGVFCVPGMGCECPAPEFVDAAFEYFHGPGCAVIGGFVYRGERLPGFDGRYLFADYCTAGVGSFSWTGSRVGDVRDHSAEMVPPDVPSLGFVSSFGMDGDGELLVISLNGSIYRIVADADCDGDGVPDPVELVTGQAFDVDGDGVPDACEPTLLGSPLPVGGTGWLLFTGALPGQTVVFFASLAGLGDGPCLPGTGLCLDLEPFLLAGSLQVPAIGTVTAGPDGAAFLPVGVPADLTGLTSVAFQAVTAAGPFSVESPPIEVAIVP